MGKEKVFIPDELMRQIANGEDAAFEKLYYLTYKPLFAYLMSLCKNAEDAADLSQETYIKVRGACHLYRDNNPMAWIMKIAKNQFLSMKRKGKNTATLNYEDCENELPVISDPIKNTEDKIYLEYLFKNLSEEELEILTLHINMGLTHSQIAKQLRSPLGTVLSKYHRAIKKLQKAEQEAQNE